MMAMLLSALGAVLSGATLLVVLDWRRLLEDAARQRQDWTAALGSVAEKLDALGAQVMDHERRVATLEGGREATKGAA